MASRIHWRSLPRSARTRLCEALRFLGPFHHNIPWRLPWTEFSASPLLDALQNSDSHCVDHATAIYLSKSPLGPTSPSWMDNPSYTRNHQHRHNLHSGRRTPDALNPKMTDLLFLAFAAVTIGAAILAIEARDLVYGAAALGIAFLGVAGLFFLLDAAFLWLVPI